MGLIGELKRRNVFRVAIAYAVISWLLAQVGEMTFETIGSPDWVFRTFFAVLVMGFPLAVFFAWAFELTPEGLKREKEVDRSQSITAQTGRKLDYVIIAVLVVAIGFLLVDRFSTEEPVAVATTDDAVSSAEVTATELERSIAVLPFDNRSDRNEDQYFTDGIHDDLLTTIANIGDLRVISRTSVMQYRGNTSKSLGQIAEELGVATILEGGVQRAGNQVRINVQLIDAATDAHLWAEIYDRELTAENLFSIQSEVSNAIASALHATLSPEERQRVNTIGTTSLEAYQEYMLGRERWYERTGEGIDTAVEYFLNAVELDPEYAAAWAGLSDAYRLQMQYSGKTYSEVIPKAELAVMRALELDPGLGEAHAALGGLHYENNELEAAIASFERAIELNPSYPYTYNWYAIVLGARGEPERALELYERGVEVDPLNLVLNSNLALNYQWSGEWERSMAQAERMIEIAPDSALGYQDVAIYHVWAAGQLDVGVEWLRQSLDHDPSFIGSNNLLAATYLSLGDTEKAGEAIERSQRLAAESSFTYNLLHMLALRLGDIDSAREYARQAVGAPGTDGMFLATEITVLNEDIENDRIDEAIGRYVSLRPELAEPETADFNWNSMWFGPSVAYLYMLQGDEAKARAVVEKTLAVSEEYPPNGWWGYLRTRAYAYAAIGDHEAALRELQALVDENVMFNMWFWLDHLPAMDELRDDLRFQALREQVEARAAEQLANVRRQAGAFEW